MGSYRASAVVPRLFALPSAPPEPRDHEASKVLHRRPPAWVHIRNHELVVEVQDEDAMELVDRALLAALLQAGLGAEKEGVRVAAAVSPPICYGKVRVSQMGGADLARSRLAAARNAAIGLLRDGGSDLPR